MACCREVVHRNRIGAGHRGQLHRQLPQRTARGPDHPPRPPLRPRAQRAGRQPRHQPRLQQRGLAGPRLPGHQQDPRPVQPPGQPPDQLARQLSAPVENRRVPLPERHQPQIRAPRPHRATARHQTLRRRTSLPSRGRQHLRGRDAPAGRRDEQAAHRLGQAQSAGQQHRGVLAGRAADAPLQVTDRPRGQGRRLGQLLLGQPRLGPQLSQQPGETQTRLLRHGPNAPRTPTARRPTPTPSDAGKNPAATLRRPAPPRHLGSSPPQPRSTSSTRPPSPTRPAGPVRSQYAKPGAPRSLIPTPSSSPRPPNNTINKWTQGISDTYALGVLAETTGLSVLTVVPPFVNTAKEAAVLAVVVTIAKGYHLGYIWKTQDHAADRSIGGYYLNAAQDGEPPGRWWGPGARALGLTPGQTVERQPYHAIYRQTDPRTGARLGRPRGRYPTFADHLARLTAAEPHATAERLIELEREAARATRQPAAYYDVTISFSKSISVLHASLRENERRARLAGDQQTAAYWAGREQQFQEVLHRANRAALKYLQAWAGITRTGYHGTRIDGREPGRFEPTGLIVTSWLQGTSRNGDPQDHIHNQIARITRTYSDGKWRALDTMSVRGVLGAVQAIAATTVECELSREFGVAWIPRADGRGNEIQGVTQAQLDAYSTRTVQVRENERELAQAWERKHGRTPTSRGLLHIANAATLQSRAGKDAGPIDWDALAARWDATLGGELAGIAPVVSNARGPGAQAGEHHVGRALSGPPAPEAQARALAKALVLVSAQHPAWTQHDLLKQLALVLPAETRQMNPEEAQELLLGLAEEALSGRSGEVVCLEAPEWARARPGFWPPSPGPGTDRCSAPPPPRTPPTASARQASRSPRTLLGCSAPSSAA